MTACFGPTLPPFGRRDGLNWPHLGRGCPKPRGGQRGGRVVGSRVEVFEQIRRDHEQGVSIRALAKRYEVHRRAVRQALENAVPPARKPPARQAPKLDGVKATIDQWLRGDLDAPRKQRHTAQRVWQRLVDEHDMTELSYSTVRDYVARRRPEVALEREDLVAERAFVPQSHLPGQDAEVDFADLWVRVDGEPTKWFLFTLRLSCSGKAVHRVFPSQGQEAFLEGHQHAFETLGGVPAGQIRYDNLKSAVSRVLFGRNRTESQRWIAFRSHYGIDPFYCIPGQQGAHEKGGVEGEVGRFRRTHLVPVPEVGSPAELNERIAAADRADERRHVEHRVRTVGQDFALERGLLRPLPIERFATGLELRPLVDRYARITVRQARYSVPARLIGRRVRVLLGASDLGVFDGRAGLDRAGAGPRHRRLHPHPRGVLGAVPPATRRRRRHPHAGRGATAAPPPAACRRGRRARRRHRGRGGQRRRRRGRGPPTPPAAPRPRPTARRPGPPGTGALAARPVGGQPHPAAPGQPARGHPPTAQRGRL